MKRSTIAGAILSVCLAAPVAAAPVQWKAEDGGNDHWYELIWDTSSNGSWAYANSKATSTTHDGMTGYLATVTSAAEQIFLNTLNAAFAASSPAHYTKYVTAWLGATDVDSEGNWTWTNGETFSYSNWFIGEPNNFFNEDYLMGWYLGGKKWNDGSNYSGIQKYVVEYDAPPVSNVPLPASLPLAAAGFGIFGLIARRRRKAA